MNQLVSIFDFCIAFNDSSDLLCFFAARLFNGIVQFELDSLYLSFFASKFIFAFFVFCLLCSCISEAIE